MKEGVTVKRSVAPTKSNPIKDRVDAVKTSIKNLCCKKNTTNKKSN